MRRRGEARRGSSHLLEALIVLEHVDDLGVRVVHRLVAERFGHEHGDRVRRRLAVADLVLEDGVEVRRVRALEGAERVAAVALQGGGRGGVSAKERGARRPGGVGEGRSIARGTWMSRARCQLTLPISVLISPLWARQRIGWASGHFGTVFVEKRRW